MRQKVAFAFAILATAIMSPLHAQPKTNLVAEATGGMIRAKQGKVHDKECGEKVDYQTEVVDLNGDGQSEVFVTYTSSCYGMTGYKLELYIKGSNGKWNEQFGFPAAEYRLLKRRNQGFPDIEIGGRGNCFPVWSWNGSKYAISKRCPG
jgi:hypothetical protein